MTVMSMQNTTSMYCVYKPKEPRMSEIISATMPPAINSGNENTESILPPVSSSADITASSNHTTIPIPIKTYENRDNISVNRSSVPHMTSMIGMRLCKAL